MRLPWLRRQIHNESIYSPVGTKSAPEVWTPRVHRSKSAQEPVPPELRRLRLRRRKPRMEPTPLYVLIPVVITLLGFLAGLVWRVAGH